MSSGAGTGARARVVGAVLVAAGRGERLGGQRPKALVEVGGRPLLAWALDGLLAAGIDHLVVVHTPDHEASFAAAVEDRDVRMVPGGAERSASVRAGLAALPDEVTVVAVHDAARAFTPPLVIRSAIDAVAGDVVAAAPGVPVADTLKRISGDQVVTTVERADLVAIQTPQVFPREVLVAVCVPGATATDDLALVEHLLATGDLSGRVVWVPGSPRGLKVTVPDDLLLAEVFAARRSPGTS